MIVKKVGLLVLLILFQSASIAQEVERPRLVVGIVVDQMRQEYLYRFADKFGEGGFKRMINQGFMMRTAHYNYMPTLTAPGHASIYTGATPSIHGIVGNEWYDKGLKKMVNCVEDSVQKPVGNPEGHGNVSPWRLLSTTVTDELKIATQMRSKVIGISSKDRGAVLPAGHTPDGAFWFDGKSGRFISSTYYCDNLPGWVNKFNALNLADKYLSQPWKTLLPIEQYTESGPDDTPYEVVLRGKDKPVFPYNLPEMRKTGGYDLITSTPFGNDLLSELAKAAIDGEELGKDNIPDFLAISFSSTDYVGHAMGPNSIELEDTYLRLDRNLADLFEVLDKKVGNSNYVVFLTADHAVADVPAYLQEASIPAGTIKVSSIEASLNESLKKYFPGKKVIERISDDQVFLNQELFAGDPKSAGIDYLIATQIITQTLIATPGISQVFSEGVLRQADYAERGIKGMIVRGYNHKRSGDIAFAMEPGWFTSGSAKGTTHGSGYNYDTHIPMLFMGKGIKKGSSVQYHPIVDVAATVAVLLRIKFPSGCMGLPISELFE